MQTGSYRRGKLLSLILGIITLAAVALLFVGDAAPRPLPAGSHDSLAAFSLAMIACAYLVFQLGRHRAVAELAKTILLAAAFLFWAANQIWINLPQAFLFNDIAIGLFVLDVFFVIVGWPAGASESILDGGCGNGGPVPMRLRLLRRLSRALNRVRERQRRWAGLRIASLIFNWATAHGRGGVSM